MGGTDGWNIGLQPGSDATLNRVESNLNIDVKTSVKDGWHVQMTKTNFAITNKKRYQVSVKAKATNPTSVTIYLAKATTPYNSYSGYSSFGFGAEEKEYTFTFIMNDPTDLAARMSFDMGLSISKISISSVKIEEILEDGVAQEVTVLTAEKEIDQSIKISPNPAKDTVNLNHDKAIKTVELVDLRGKVIFSKQNNFGTLSAFNVTGLDKGLYVVNFFTNKNVFSRKLVISN